MIYLHVYINVGLSRSLSTLDKAILIDTEWYWEAPIEIEWNFCNCLVEDLAGMIYFLLLL